MGHGSRTVPLDSDKRSQWSTAGVRVHCQVDDPPAYAVGVESPVPAGQDAGDRQPVGVVAFQSAQLVGEDDVLLGPADETGPYGSPGSATANEIRVGGVDVGESGRTADEGRRAGPSVSR
ncbi:hypothetical protein [Solwaraspora sp. WMMA2101]|uniref:hypothetical protein n=1 Tax=Solwaraspora sp. WMMA2101 TaxID=3404124 RepID=UPI003B9610E5